MRKRFVWLVGCVLLILLVTYPVTAYVGSADNADKGNRPDVIIEYGKGKDAGLVKVTHIHYAKSPSKGKPPATATCYKLAGWKWSGPITYTVDTSDSSLVRAVEAADAEWDSNTGQTLFNAPKEGTYAWGVRDFHNSISFGNYKTSDVIAVTTTWYVRGSKTAVESDILFDTDFPWGDAATNLSVMDLQNIATHEIGHTLGLSDLYTSSCSQVTMFGYSTEGDIDKRTLEPSDIIGLQKLYGT
jgi:hypothetical protein